MALYLSIICVQNLQVVQNQINLHRSCTNAPDEDVWSFTFRK